MDNQKARYASLTLDFLKLIGKESKALSDKAGVFIESAEASSVVSLVAGELVMMKVSLESLSQFCTEAIETCHITDDDIVQVPPDQFIRITDASTIGMGAYKEAERYISFLEH